MELTTYKVTFIESADEWIFQYRKTDGIVYSFTNLKGTRILNLFKNRQFPETVDLIEQWTKLKKIVRVELVLDDYSFETFWELYGLKVKKDKSEKAFNSLSFVDKVLCFAKLAHYEDHLKKTGQAKAHLVTWINQKRYNDEY
jgi:hypothetical protein